MRHTRIAPSFSQPTHKALNSEGKHAEERTLKRIRLLGVDSSLTPKHRDHDTEGLVEGV